MATNGRETRYSPERIEHFKSDKKQLLDYRIEIQNTGSKFFPTFFKGSELQQKVFKDYTELMKKRLNHDEELSAKLIPDFQVGCRRLVSYFAVCADRIPWLMVI